MIKLITIGTIPHQDQRYDTCGDWQFDTPFKHNLSFETLEIRVSDSKDEKMNFLVAVHEYIEAMLCRWRDVSEQSVDEWDMSHPNFAGSDSLSESLEAPTGISHNDALAIEWLLSRLIGVDWKEYTKALDDMGWGKGKSNASV